MPQSLANLCVHLIFSTKDRYPYLKDDSIRKEVWHYLGGICNGLECQPVIVGGYHDHIHLLARQSKNIALKDWVRELKRASSIWIKSQRTQLNSFQWQSGYGAFSVSQSSVDEVRKYIIGQDSHHQRISFQEEFRIFLVRSGMDFDERYVWD
ncbi:IS200/IS605 family transposase [Rubellicoccus peritrichatus]|uniref:IS200/IS605 family transposase n=1 Tax=Rubellicoccus peritrichatus TaxID=3080537 RepID=A0AAQ3LDQ0_9BACT|nr:IS200/IS605 family transposase [Puniceicoccus sp. CR14]WOO43482.1 IS200/IS605 family transposase [Puniceicoccus sp. CR14]